MMKMQRDKHNDKDVVHEKLWEKSGESVVVGYQPYLPRSMHRVLHHRSASLECRMFLRRVH